MAVVPRRQAGVNHAFQCAHALAKVVESTMVGANSHASATLQPRTRWHDISVKRAAAMCAAEHGKGAKDGNDKSWRYRGCWGAKPPEK